MNFVVIGVGYTGRRVLAMLPADRSFGMGRSTIDLDAPPRSPPAFPRPFTVLYTVPPRRDTDGDPRLQAFLSLLDPPPDRFVYLSTTGVYGDRNGARVDEDDVVSPQSERAKKRLAAEQLLESWCDEKDVALVILRLPGIYGPGRLGLERIEAAAPLITEKDANPGNRIHVDDLAACCVQAMTGDVATGVYNVGDGDHRSSTWFAKTVARYAGLDAPPEISYAEAERTFGPMRLSFLRESRIVDTTKLRDVLGFVPRYANAEDGIRASLV